MTNSTERLSGRHILIHADGACIGNPGPGGYAAVLRRMDGDTEIKVKRLSGGDPDTTNNRMELGGVIAALAFLKRDEADPITIFSDSKYVIDGMRTNLAKWKVNGWRTSSKTAVKNEAEWRALDVLAHGLTITPEWVKGHAGDARNEEVDAMAEAAALRFKRKLV
ncbi:MAG: ribonuclease H [Mesorhizobium sp.]|nr:ribonuclease H [Mesorhizobium sp.]